MARFYGTIQGRRGEASRLGDSKSGLRTTTRGWELGATCEMSQVNRDGQDIDQLDVSINKGSSYVDAYFGGFSVQRQGEGVVIRPDQKFLETMRPQDVAALLSRTQDEKMVEWVAGLLIRSETWAKFLRGQLFVSGKASE